MYAPPRSIVAPAARAAGDADEVVALDGAGARDDLEVPPADLDAMAAVDDRVGRMELPVCLLEGLGDALDPFDDIHGFEEERVDPRGVADQPDDGLVLAVAHVGLEAFVLDPGDQALHGLAGRALAQDGDHIRSSVRSIECLGG